MRIGLDDFVEQNYIGDWVLDDNVHVDRDTMLDELKLIAELPEEFSINLYDAMLKANLYGIETDTIERLIRKSFHLAKLEKEYSDICKRCEKFIK
jgi:hypothetical protein